MKKITYNVLEVLLILLHFSAQGQSVCVKHYTTNDGLAGDHVYMCHQDNNGYLWIATTSGLSRFDGKKFKNYGHEDGLPDNEVLFVTNDADNNIWARTFSATPAISVVQNAALNNSNSRAITRKSIVSHLVSDELYSRDHKLTYLNGRGCLICIKAGKVRKVFAPLMAGSSVFETEDGKFFAGNGKNLYFIHDTTVMFFQMLAIPQAYTRLCYYNHLLYVVAGNAIYLFEYEANRFSYLSTKRFKENINLVHANQNGIWLTFGDKRGLYLYRDWQMRSKQFRIPLEGIVNYIMTDEDDALWICTTDNGIFCVPYPDVISYTENDGLSSSVVYTLDPLSSHTFWAGYNTGNADLIDITGNNVHIKRKVNLALHKYSSDFIVGIAHNDHKTFVLSRSKLLEVENNRFLPPTAVHKSVLVVDDTTIGIGAWDYILLNLKTLRQDVFQIKRIYAQSKDSIGNLWLGGMDGLYYLQVKPKSKPIRIKGLENIRINTLAIYKDFVWVGSQNNGLYLVKGNKIISQFTENNTRMLPSNIIKALAVKGNEIWIGTNRGILRASFDTLKLHFNGTLLLDHNDGLLSSEVNDIKVFDSSVFIATYNGITIINKYTRKKLNYVVSDVFVRAQNKHDQIRSDSIELTYSTKGLEIGIQAAALKYPNDITYRYRLIPFDQSWNITKTNLIQYTNIPPGNYTFVVTAFDNRGNSSTSPTYRYIHIRPIYWQTLWFKCTLGLVALAVAAMLIFWYMKTAKKRMNNQILQDREIAMAKLEVFRSQLKPHFIFNSLNAIKDYIYNNKNDDAASLLQGFAGLIRKGLNLAGEDFISIAEEVSFLQQYLELEQLKCDNCFDYSIDVPEEMTTIVIPSLITQPFVENAIIHGVRSVKNERAALNITYSLNKNDVVCSITDNGIGVKQSLLHKKAISSKGTLISKERINYFRTGLGVEIELEIIDLFETCKTKNGTTIVITVRNAHKLSKNENRNQNTNH